MASDSTGDLWCPRRDVSYAGEVAERGEGHAEALGDLRADARQLQAELDALRDDLGGVADAFDPGLSALAADVFEPVYSRWLHVDAHGLEHVPGSGAALVVGGH